MIYILHFDKPFSHALHYVGYCEKGNLESRLESHRNGSGANLMAHLKKAGIGFTLVRVFEEGTRTEERKLKNCKKTKQYCPICSNIKNPKRK